MRDFQNSVSNPLNYQELLGRDQDNKEKNSVLTENFQNMRTEQ